MALRVACIVLATAANEGVRASAYPAPVVCANTVFQSLLLIELSQSKRSAVDGGHWLR